MASDTQTQTSTALPRVQVPLAQSKADLATILGLGLSFGMIVLAVILGQSEATFFNLPSFLIVIIGTMTATAVSFTGMELRQSAPTIFGSVIRPVRDFSALAKSMLDLASIARQRGILQLTHYEKETAKEPFLKYALGLVVDGYDPDDVERILQQDIDAEEERNKRAANVLRRASEVAPAMGLIGTLVGLVQMLSNLQNPESIGSDMALALLTTFYGAILGTVVMSPLAAKLEKNAADEVTAKTMTLKTAVSMMRQENPRNLEMMINSLLPPSQRIVYFK